MYIQDIRAAFENDHEANRKFEDEIVKYCSDILTKIDSQMDGQSVAFSTQPRSPLDQGVRFVNKSNIEFSGSIGVRLAVASFMIELEINPNSRTHGTVKYAVVLEFKVDERNVVVCGDKGGDNFMNAADSMGVSERIILSAMDHFKKSGGPKMGFTARL